jgi:hypothetical protein
MFSSSPTKVIFRNQSSLFLDSVKVYIQSDSIILKNINAGYSVEKHLFPKSSSTHSVTIRTMVYQKTKSRIKNGFLYTDLMGSLEDVYIITLGKDLILKID